MQRQKSGEEQKKEKKEERDERRKFNRAQRLGVGVDDLDEIDARLNEAVSALRTATKGSEQARTPM